MSAQRSTSRGFLIAVTAGGLLCGFACVWWYLVFYRDSGPATSAVGPLRTTEELRSAQEATWAAAPMLEIESTEPRELEAWMLDAVKPEASLPPEAARALASTVVRQYRARASRDPSDYIKLAESEGTHWAKPQLPMAWEAIRQRYVFLMKKEPDPKNLRSVLKTLIDAGVQVDGSRYVKVAMDGPGRRVEVRKVRTLDEADSGQFNTVEDYEYWFGAPSHNAFRLRAPLRSLQDVLSKHGSTWYAEVRLVVETERGSRVGWLSCWYWDPESRSWNNRSMTLHTWPMHATFY
ncbi:MAG: hypothetical protein ACKVZJ_07250 [Phycisphaerales bacterium]